MLVDPIRVNLFVGFARYYAFFGQFGLSVVVVAAAAVVVVRYSVGTSVALDVKHQIPK